MGWGRGPQVPDEYRFDESGVGTPATAPGEPVPVADERSGRGRPAGGDEPPEGDQRRLSRGSLILLGLAIWFIITTVINVINRM